MRRFALLGLLSSLVACSEPTGAPGPGDAGAAINQPPSVQHMQLARAAGLNPPSAIAGVAKAEGGNARDVAMTASMTINPIGMSAGAGLAGGVIGILAAPPAPAEAWDVTLVQLPAHQSKVAFARQMQDAVARMTPAWERPGYAPIEVGGQRLYSKCGGGGAVRPAWNCLSGIEVILTPVGKLGDDTIYMMRTQEYGGVRFLKNNPNANVDQHKALSRAFPGKVYTYMAPRRAAKGWTPAGIYDAGRIYPL